jgi:hypothetical protein
VSQDLPASEPRDPSDMLGARRRKPFGEQRGAPPPALECAYHDARVAALVADGNVTAARNHLLTRLRSAGEDVVPYLDIIRLERAQGEGVWQNWMLRGLANCPDLAPRLIASLPEEALSDYAVNQEMPWRAVRGQRDARAAHHLFALRVGELLWLGRIDDALDAVAEAALLERAEHEPAARELIVSVLAVTAWRDPEGVRETASRLGVALSEPDSEAPPYPMDVLEHAHLLGQAYRRANARAQCPPELARAFQLGPFFGGRHARTLLEELSTALRDRPHATLRFCDAVVETPSALSVYLAETVAELALETPGPEGDPDDARAARAIDDLARASRRRRGAAALSAVTAVACGAWFAGGGQWQLAAALAAPAALGAWALLGFLRDASYLPRVRPALVRALVSGRADVPALRREMRGRAELTWIASRLERDQALCLLGALAAQRSAAASDSIRPR